MTVPGWRVSRGSWGQEKVGTASTNIPSTIAFSSGTCCWSWPGVREPHTT